MNYFVCAPANYKSGGPESLHQLCFDLSKHRKAYMYYYGKSQPGQSTSNFFAKYKLEHVSYIPDNEDTVVVIPETYTQFSKSFNKAHVVIWWLATTHYFSSRGLIEYLPNYLLKYYTLKQISWILKNRIKDLNARKKHIDFISDEKILHLYGTDFTFMLLDRMNIVNRLRLNQPLSNSFIVASEKLKNKKKNLILYNPIKVYRGFSKLIERLKAFEFIPIVNMSEEEVIRKMSTAKVYLDFGYFPGPERLPREAAIMDCIIITSNYGTASSEIDMPIPFEYKFDIDHFELSRLENLLLSIFNDFDYHHLKMREFRELIYQRNMDFELDVYNLVSITDALNEMENEA